MIGSSITIVFAYLLLRIGMNGFSYIFLIAYNSCGVSLIDNFGFRLGIGISSIVCIEESDI